MCAAAVCVLMCCFHTQVPEFIKLICKVFWSATFMGIPELLVQQEHFQGWMMAFHTALRKPLPWVRQLANWGQQSSERDSGGGGCHVHISNAMRQHVELGLHVAVMRKPTGRRRPFCSTNMMVRLLIAALPTGPTASWC